MKLIFFFLLSSILILPVSAQSWSDLLEEAGYYYKSQQYEKAITYAGMSVNAAVEEFGTMHPATATAMNNLAFFNQLAGHLETSRDLYLEVLRIKEEIYGKVHQSYITSLTSLAALYVNLQDDESAIRSFQESLLLKEQVFGQASDTYLFSLSSLADIFWRLQRFEDVIPVYQEMLDVYHQMYGATSEQTALALHNLGSAYLESGQTADALVLLKQAMDLRISLLGIEHPYTLMTASNYAMALHQGGAFSEALELYRTISEVQERVLGSDHPDHALLLNNIALLCADMGLYDESESNIMRSASIYKKVYGEESADYGQSMESAGLLFLRMGNMEKGSVALYQALAACRKETGDESLITANVYGNLGYLYTRKGILDSAVWYLQRSVGIREKWLPAYHPDLGNLYNNLGAAYLYLATDYEKAAGYFNLAEDIRRQVLGTEHPDYLITLNNVIMCEVYQGHHTEAQAALAELIDIKRQVMGPYHPSLGISIENLAAVEQMDGQDEAAESHAREALDILRYNLERNFGFLSEQEKSYYAAATQYEMDLLQSLFLHDADRSGMAEMAWELTILRKGMILASGISLRESIERSGDQELTEIYGQWADLRRALAEQYQLPFDKRMDGWQTMEETANEMEKQLARQSAAFNRSGSWLQTGDLYPPEGVAWVEFIHGNLFQDMQWTDSVVYAAAIRKSGQATKLVRLISEEDLDSIMHTGYTGSDAVSALYMPVTEAFDGEHFAGTDLYHYLWEPLVPFMEDVETVVYSPDGLIHQLAPEAFPFPGGGYLMDQFELIRTGSTSDTELGQHVNWLSGGVVLFGGIWYDEQIQNNTISEDSSWSASEMSRGKGWNYLPGTMTEVSSIADLIASKGFVAKVYAENSATEEVFYQVADSARPAVIHIATHGFFMPDPEPANAPVVDGNSILVSAENALDRSGLLLAGANANWIADRTAGSADDGILVASEISHLPLQQVQLVVLSACETGLGKINGTEGVYGLQRAFMGAGAANLIMSLWQVPDLQTAQFMQQFYAHILAGEDLDSSMNSARMTIRKKYPDPYYWAGFVLMH